MQLPNTLSLSIIAGLQLVINQNYADLWWTPIALAALLAVGKLLQVGTTPEAATKRGLSPEGMEEPEPSKFKRWLVG